jgi:hypothetical protein
MLDCVVDDTNGQYEVQFGSPQFRAVVVVVVLLLEKKVWVVFSSFLLTGRKRSVVVDVSLARSLSW